MKLNILTIVCLFTATTAVAQNERSSSSQFLSTVGNSEVVIPYRIGDEGVKFPVRWGMDTAWNSSGNMNMGINHIGKENLTLVRGSFRYGDKLVGDTALTNGQANMLRRRIQTTNLISDSVDIILNSDQEAGIDESWYGTTGNANVAHWVAMISAHIDYIKKNYPKHRVIGISPFNEPDYNDWKQGSKANMKEISRQLKERYPGLLITAGNTLNCDQALSWYNAVKPYVDWGCTHQLAGSFDSYANFFKKVRDDGNYGYADELHNVGEAMVGVEYGMQAGVWWGFDSRARGEFCRISNSGSRIGYGENRAKWTAAAVYRARHPLQRHLSAPLSVRLTRRPLASCLPTARFIMTDKARCVLSRWRFRVERAISRDKPMQSASLISLMVRMYPPLPSRLAFIRL